MVITQNINAGNETAELGVGGENVVQLCKGSQSVNTAHSPFSPLGALKTKMLHFPYLFLISRRLQLLFLYSDLIDCFY